MRKWLYFFRQLGFDPIKSIQAVRAIPVYVLALFRFRLSTSEKNFALSPILQDFNAQAGSADGHYFWQDLIVAKWIYERTPSHHFDVGSRIDGFIAHLLSFREVSMLDIRPLANKIPGLQVVLGDAQKPLTDIKDSFESVSSLHAIEHFGLGRYRDQLEADGHIKGLQNIAKTVRVGGNLYVSFPIGTKRVEFNEQRIIEPLFPLEILPDFKLEEFVLIPWKGAPILGIHPSQVDKKVRGQAGVYRFRRVN
jgi:hypothetical protein